MEPDAPERTSWTFTPHIVSYEPGADTRALSSEEVPIRSLTALVFRGNESLDRSSGQSGKTFLYASEAKANGDGSYSADLVPSSEPRIIHVIANYDFTGRRQGVYKDMDEGELIPRLVGPGSYYWCRIRVPGIPDSGELHSTQDVELLRSFAKVSLTIGQGVDISDWSLKAIHASSDGSVAPFDPGSTTFSKGHMTIPPEATPTGTITGGVGKPLYLAEREYTSDNPLYIILSCKIGGQQQYYKIDLLNQDDKGIHRYDLIRNHQYIIHIKAIKRAGYPTEQEAIDGQPVNSTVLDYRMEAFPQLYSDDGTAMLTVEQTTFNVGAQGSSFPTTISYRVDGKVRNDMIITTVEGDDSENPLLILKENKDEQGNFNGTLFITCKPLPEGKPSRSASIYISAGEGTKQVRRVITVKQFAPFSLLPAKINDADPAEIATESGPGKEATISFAIPEDYPEHLLPVPVTIETNTLNPISSLPLTTKEGRISYTYMATTKGLHKVPFRTTKSHSQEVVRLSAPNFLPAITGYNVGQFFGNITYTYNGQTKPLPRSSEQLEVSEGSIVGPLASSGDDFGYKLLVPVRLLETASPETTSIHLSVRIPVEERGDLGSKPSYRIFSTEIPVRELRERHLGHKTTSLNLNLQHTSTLIFGSLSARNYPGQDAKDVVIPTGTEISFSIKSDHLSKPLEAKGKVFRDNSFEMEYPVKDLDRNSHVEVKVRRIELTKRTGAIEEIYEVEPGTDMLVGILDSRQISLKRTQLRVFGQCIDATHTLLIKSMTVYWFYQGEKQAKWREVTRPSRGRYICELPPELREDTKIEFQVRWNTNPSRKRTLNMLRESTYLYFGAEDEWP